FPATAGGGAESQVRTLALRLRQRGHRVTVLTPRFRHAPQACVQRHDGVPVCRIAYPRVRILGTLVLWLRVWAFLRARRRRYDVWHVHIAHHLGALACRAGAGLGVPVVVKISGWWELERGLLRDGGVLRNAFGRRWLRRATATQAISRRIEAELVAKGFPPRAIVALPNAIDTARFRPGAPADDAERTLTAVFVGRLVPEKGLDLLLDAWAAAFPAPGRARLRLVGTGAVEAELRARAERLGIAAQVEFLGHRDDVESVLHEADFGVLPSTIEGLSNTLLEFMASGLPVVASRISGSEDFVVDGRNGWLFPSRDLAALAERLRAAAALERTALRALGRQARVDVESRAGLDRVVDRLLTLYRGGDPRAASAPSLDAPAERG
ncbi:MAG TPA: glycosyltransferase family 4 protein, partial [Dokdonella sp.]